MQMIRRIAAELFVVLAFAAICAAQSQMMPKEINGGVLNGKAVELPKPDYPDDLKAAKVEATVQVQVVIDEGGNVVSAKGVEPLKDGAGSIDPRLIQLAENAALAARFSPTLLSGQPVKVKGIIVYNFTAAESCISGGSGIGAGTLNSRAVELPIPDYPAAAAAVRAEGQVIVFVQVDPSGDVVCAAAESGHPLLRAAAVKAARAAKFGPVTDGPAVKYSGLLLYNFTAPKSDK